MNQCRQSGGGFSLIEVLVALLVFSIGLIGLAGLMVMSSQANHGAFVRTQATFLAHNLADRMRANPIGVWQGGYNGTWPTSDTAPTCDASSACTPAQMATRDRVLWGDMLSQYLPNDSNLAASVTCTPQTNGLTISNYYQVQPPYNGSCTMNITWTERSLALNGSPAPQTFAWTFQP